VFQGMDLWCREIISAFLDFGCVYTVIVFAHAEGALAGGIEN
jgi:hypothetical protein